MKKEQNIIRKVISVHPKTGQLCIEPDFMNDKVLIHPIHRNHISNVKKDEEWEGYFLNEKSLNRTTKDNKALYLQVFVPIKRVDYTEEYFNRDSKIWKVKIYSGNRLIKQYEDKSSKIEQIVQLPGTIKNKNDIPFPWYLIEKHTSPSGEDTSNVKIDEFFPLRVFSHNSPVPVWAKDKWEKHKEKVKQTYLKLARKEQERLMTEKKKKNIVIKGKNKVPEDIVEEFIRHGVKIITEPDHTDARLPLWGYEHEIFEINGFRWTFETIDWDEDYWEYELISSDKSFNKKGKDILFSFAHFAVINQNKIRNYSPIPAPVKERLSLPDKIEELYSNSLYTNFESKSINRTTVKTYTTEQEERKWVEREKRKIKEIVEKAKNLYKPIENKYLRFIPVFDSRIERDIDFEEGVGKKDATYWSREYLKATVNLIWQVQIKNNMIHEELTNEILKRYKEYSPKYGNEQEDGLEIATNNGINL